MKKYWMLFVTGIIFVALFSNFVLAEDVKEVTIVGEIQYAYSENLPDIYAGDIFGIRFGIKNTGNVALENVKYELKSNLLLVWDSYSVDNGVQIYGDKTITIPRIDPGELSYIRFNVGANYVGEEIIQIIISDDEEQLISDSKGLIIQEEQYVEPVCGDGVCEIGKGEDCCACSEDCGLCSYENRYKLDIPYVQFRALPNNPDIEKDDEFEIWVNVGNYDEADYENIKVKLEVPEFLEINNSWTNYYGLVEGTDEIIIPHIDGKKSCRIDMTVFPNQEKCDYDAQWVIFEVKAIENGDGEISVFVNDFTADGEVFIHEKPVSILVGELPDENDNTTDDSDNTDNTNTDETDNDNDRTTSSGHSNDDDDDDDEYIPTTSKDDEDNENETIRIAGTQKITGAFIDFVKSGKGFVLLSFASLLIVLGILAIIHFKK